jgi:response regulator RpfG family c-di-GMP phosphodiesterase
MKKVLLARGLKKPIMEKSSFLERSGVEIFTAATNEELLQVHKKERVDLIVTRLDLPGKLKCEELFSVVREKPDLRDVSTIIICKDTLAHRDRVMHCKANAFFTMPVKPVLLHLKMQQYLNIAPRKDYRAALAIAISGKFKNTPLPFKTENISSSGMLIRAEEPLRKGDGVYFSFFLPNGTHVSGYGEIARVDKVPSAPGVFLYGIKYTDVEPEVKSLIEATIKK